MNELLEILLRIAGLGLIALCFVHIPIGKRLAWREDAKKLTPANEQIFHVHTFFICTVLVLMGLPCLVQPSIFLERTAAGLWLTASLTVFWSFRLYFQLLVYKSDLWKGKTIETSIHYLFCLVWSCLVLVFGACWWLQLGG